MFVFYRRLQFRDLEGIETDQGSRIEDAGRSVTGNGTSQ